MFPLIQSKTEKAMVINIALLKEFFFLKTLFNKKNIPPTNDAKKIDNSATAAIPQKSPPVLAVLKAILIQYKLKK